MIRVPNPDAITELKELREFKRKALIIFKAIDVFGLETPFYNPHKDLQTMRMIKTLLLESKETPHE